MLDVVVVCTLNVSGFDMMENADVQYANTCYKNVTFSKLCVVCLDFLEHKVHQIDIKKTWKKVTSMF